LTHSALASSPYFKATAGGEGSGSINKFVCGLFSGKAIAMRQMYA
jgi:hypothetical protein